MKDTYRHQGLRRQLIDALRQKGLRDERVLEAMLRLPRHFFLEAAFAEKAYQNVAFPIGVGQTISQPYTVAYQTSLLEVRKRDKVLEIGTGSGYQAAVLALLEARVFTIERQEFLYQKTKTLLQKIGLKGIRCYHRDGYKGMPEMMPFDKILVTCGAEEVPEALKSQLKIGGILVVPVGKEGRQKMLKITRLSSEEYNEESLEDFKFVPFLKGVEKL